MRLTSAKADVLLFQIGDGPVAFDRAAIERSAFLQAKDEFYTEETVQGEPIKGNFTNVARVRTTGALLGPTNYHAYQPALRKLYEERFSRRMSFPEFQQHEIEIVSDEQTVAAWKEQARNSTTYTTRKEAEPISFKTLFDVEQHFRKSYLPQLVTSAPTLECSGPASRAAVDRHVASAVRDAWEKERAFPQGMVNALRPFFAEAGLHFFKHRKRVLCVGAIKPARHSEGHPFSDGITSILKTVEAQPRIKRPQLAAAIMGEGHESPEAAPRKAQLAADLHYLIHAGHVIEFADGALDLPLSPKGEAPHEKPAGPAAMAGKKTSLPAVPAADAVTEESLVPPSAPGGGRPDEGGLVAEEPPPAEEEPVPGEEEGEADPIEAAEYAPILSEQSESAALEGETPSGDPITPETMEAIESAPFENPAGKSSQSPPA